MSLLRSILDKPQHDRADQHPAAKKVAEYRGADDQPEYEQARRNQQVYTPEDIAAIFSRPLISLLKLSRWCHCFHATENSTPGGRSGSRNGGERETISR